MSRRLNEDEDPPKVIDVTREKAVDEFSGVPLDAA
jgi:hypothetical protein